METMEILKKPIDNKEPYNPYSNTGYTYWGDSEEHPYIKKGLDDIPRINHMYESCSTPPIFGVELEYGGYQIFIGEKPIRDTNGDWVLTNPDAITFIISYGFYGASELVTYEPRLIKIIPQDAYLRDRTKSNDEFKRLQSLLNKPIHFKDWVKDKWKRTTWWYKSHFPYFHYYKGERSKMIKFIMPKYIFTIEYVWKMDGTEKHFCVSTEKWNRFLTIKAYNEWCWRYNKYENDGTSCAL